jgi:lipoprotein-anchoring transpeptidase ErfK/SrfK
MLRRRLDLERHGSGGYTSIGRLVAMVLAIGFFVLSGHLIMQAWFAGRIMPGVVVADQNIGGMTTSAARGLIENVATQYHVHLKVGSQNFTLTPGQLGVTFNTAATVENAYAVSRNVWLPSVGRTDIGMSYRVDLTKLDSVSASIGKAVGSQPVDAGLVVSGVQLTTTPQKNGWTVNRVGLEKLILADVRSPTTTDLSLEPTVQLADIQSSALGPTIAETKHILDIPITLVYENSTFAPTPAQIGKWLTFQKQPDGVDYKLVPTVDISKLKGYVQTIANQVNQAPIPEKDTVVNGVSKVSQAGQNGTAIDQNALTAAIQNAITNQVPLNYTITSSSLPFSVLTTSLTSLNYPSYIEVNLSKQHLWVWQNQTVIYDSPITSGATGAGFPTATGLFHIYYKTTNTHLIGYQYGPRYDYDVAVQYWMPFYEGFGLHDASWRHGDFGGSDYYYGGSHGCVNLPLATAAFIYNWSVVGTPVWVHS